MEQTSRQAAIAAGGKVVAESTPDWEQAPGGAPVQQRLNESVNRLEQIDASLSARTGLWPAQQTWLIALTAAALVCTISAPATIGLGLQFLFALALAYYCARGSWLCIMHYSIILTPAGKALSRICPAPDSQPIPC